MYGFVVDITLFDGSTGYLIIHTHATRQYSPVVFASYILCVCVCVCVCVCNFKLKYNGKCELLRSFFLYYGIHPSNRLLEK